MDESIHLYSVRDKSAEGVDPKSVEGVATNEELKQQVNDMLAEMKIGEGRTKGKVSFSFDRDVKAYRLDAEGVSAATMSKITKAASNLTSDTAKAAWSSESEMIANNMKALRAEAAKRIDTTPENGPAKERAGKIKEALANGGKSYVTFVTPPEMKAFNEKLGEIDGVSAYHAKGNANLDRPHREVVSASPKAAEALAGWMGAEAEARFVEHGRSAAPKQSAKETVREAAKARSGGAFMAKFGAGLAVYARNSEWADLAANATNKQLELVERKTSEAINALYEKEMQQRSKQSGMSVAQLKALAEERKFSEVRKHGEGLEGKDASRLQALRKGLSELRTFMKDERGITSKESRKEVDRVSNKQKETVGAEAGKEQKAPAKRTAPKGRDQAGDDAMDLAVQQMADGRRRGAGR